MPSATKAAPRGGVDYSVIDREIISRIDARAVFVACGVRFTGAAPNPLGWLECHAVGREDAKPSAGCHLATGRYKDFATGDNLSLWEFAAAYGGGAYGATWRDARNILAAQAGVPIPEANGHAKPFKHLELQPWGPNSDSLLALWCRAKPGITPEAIRAAGGRIGRYRDRFTVIAVPVVGPDFNRDKPIGWIVWEITGKDLPTYKSGQKEPAGWVKMLTVAGSRKGLICLRSLPDGDATGATLWKTEGPTDAMALWAAIKASDGDTKALHVIVTNSDGCAGRPEPWQLAMFSNRANAAFVVHDADEPGQDGALRWAQAIASTGAIVRNVQLPFAIEPKHGKDLRDFLTTRSFGELFDIAQRTEPMARGVAVQVTNEADDDPHRLARQFLAARYTVDGTPTLRHWQNEWYAWNGQCYRRLSDSCLRAQFTSSIKDEFDRIGGDDGPIKVTRNIVANALQALHAMVTLPDECAAPAWLAPGGWEPRSREILICANGWIDLGDDEQTLNPLSPRLWMHNAVPYAYDPTAPIPSHWLDFLCNQWHNGEVSDPETVDLLQEWFGYCLTTDNRHEKIMMIVGSPRSGKGTIADTLAALIGEENRCSTSLSALATRFGLEPLIGKSLAVIGDARLSGRSDIAALVERLLSVSGSDPQSIDRKRIQAIETRLTARFMVLTNELPNLRDASGAMASRFLIVETTKSFLGAEDKALKADLKSPDILPGILNWAIEGHRRLSQRGSFLIPESSREAIKELEALTSPIYAFLSDCCTTGKGLSIDADELFRHYVQWCKDEERPPQTRAMFGRDLHSRGIKKSRVRAGAHRAYYYRGVDLAEKHVSEAAHTKVF